MIIIKRKIKLIIFVLIFLIASPFIILYANGDIFGGGWGFFKTGGIYISGAPVGSDIYINSRLTNKTSFFDRDILIKNLKKGKYEIVVKKEGYNSWAKVVSVYENLVGDANVFILPKKVEKRQIFKYLVPGSNISTSTTTKNKNQEYIDILDIFSKKPTAAKNTTPTSSIDFKSNLGTRTSPIMDGKIGLWNEGGKIFSKWFGNNDLAPKYFCKVEDCTKTILVRDLQEIPRRINYLPEYSGVVLIALDEKIFAIQIEENQKKTLQIIYVGITPDFRIENGALYIKDGTRLFEVLL